MSLILSTEEKLRPLPPCLTCWDGLVWTPPCDLSLSAVHEVLICEVCNAYFYGTSIWSSHPLCHKDPGLGTIHQYFLSIIVPPKHTSLSVIRLPDPWCFSWYVTLGASADREGEILYIDTLVHSGTQRVTEGCYDGDNHCQHHHRPYC